MNERIKKLERARLELSDSAAQLLGDLEDAGETKDSEGKTFGDVADLLEKVSAADKVLEEGSK